ncbi:MAG: peptidyl-prolyl cis-trans isomerase [Bryobacterales bacterium]|nr:peptidyl-prolyl cis-trans isomerase [Bryobacterales bacterium]
MTCSRLLAGLFLISGFAAAQAALPLKPGLYAVFDTSEGTITAQLYERYTPLAVKNFVGLATGSKPWWDPKAKAFVKRPMYNGITFHRIVREQMIQSGDPTGLGTHNCGFTLRDEFLPGLRFDGPGRLAVANTGQPDSGACQFFITDQMMPSWNGKYTVFGQVVQGQDVVGKINRVRTFNEKPLEPVLLKSVSIRRVTRDK